MQTGGNVSILVQAEDYTNYYDTTPGNTGGAYKSDDVDIEVTSDNGGGHNVGFIVANEFLEYSLDLPAGIYAISARVASEVSSGEYAVSLNEQVVGTASVSATGGWQTFITQTLGSMQLSAATTFTLKFYAIAGDFNLNWLLIETVFDSDLSVPGASACNGSCAQNWPPLLVTDGLASGVSGLGTIIARSLRAVSSRWQPT
ncbi:carbohydrate-binding domain-containing protein [Paraglaciecola sp. MB-3u-78]|uniref:carbohydrate-binding protein n=1 Tax=Paraglaciecola sp. MB-3u-78 TaxID=2058332 RepID=UPI000C331336|nr:carbohydrate-binding domain-containing protein [Paraglaciecola sp. MB-3u-78]PKG98007.1 hypothetical protein CXF95_16520 [Paraglaciecola sp. MB-3u-78]